MPHLQVEMHSTKQQPSLIHHLITNQWMFSGCYVATTTITELTTHGGRTDSIYFHDQEHWWWTDILTDKMPFLSGINEYDNQ